MTLHDQSNIVLIVAYILKGILLFPHYFHQVLVGKKLWTDRQCSIASTYSLALKSFHRLCTIYVMNCCLVLHRHPHVFSDILHDAT